MDTKAEDLQRLNAAQAGRLGECALSCTALDLYGEYEVIINIFKFLDIHAMEVFSGCIYNYLEVFDIFVHHLTSNG